MENCSIVYNILPTNTNSTLETAKTLNIGEWVEFYYDSNNSKHYFCIGECKAGEVIRISSDTGNNGDLSSVSIVNANGKELGSNSDANYTFKIREDGIYYLAARASITLDEDGKLQANRLRYDIGSCDEQATSIECATSITLLEGESVFLDLRCKPYNVKTGDTYSYDTFGISTSDYNVLTISSYGYLTARSAGTGTLTVGLCSSSIEKEIPVTVLAKDSLSASDVSISGAPESLAHGKSVYLTAAYTLKDGVVLTNPEKAVTWTSSDTKVLYVSPGGKVTAVGGGTATVTASVGGVSEESAPITVTAAPETPQETVSSIKLNKYSLTLYVGEAGEQLTASILPEGSTARVTWASSNTKAAAVSPDGVVTPIAPGMSTITAEAGGRHVSATVSVLAERVRVSGVSFDETEHKIPVRGTAKLTATIAPADATVKTLVWTSDDPGIASVSRTGIVTAVSVGTTKIHATSVDGNHSAEVTVTVTAAPQLGDVNGDGYIDSADAMLCLRSAVGLKKLTEEQKSAADVNKDGFVDAGDAIKILRYDAKLIDSLN